MVYLPLNENSIGSWKTRSDWGLQNEYTTMQSLLSLFKVLQFPCLYPTYSFWKCLRRTGRWLITRALLREASLQETFCAQCHPQTPAASGLEKLCGSPETPAIYVLLQKAGPVKVTNTPSLCTHTSAEAQKTQQTVDMLGEPASKVHLALMSVMKVILMQ